MMVNYVVHDCDGNILRSGTCQRSVFEFQPQQGEYVIEGVCDQLLDMVEDGVIKRRPTPPPPPLNEVYLAYEELVLQAVSSHLTAVARSLGYDSIDTACSYAGAPNKYQQQSIDVLQWRASVWECCYGKLLLIKSGELAMPSVSNFIALLPQYKDGQLV